MSLTGIKELDMTILSYVDTCILNVLESHIKDILDDQNFWKLRLKNKLELTSNTNIDYRSVTEFLDNDKVFINHYMESDINMLNKIINLRIDDYPLFLLNKVNVGLSFLQLIANKTYEKFIDKIVEETNFELKVAGFCDIMKLKDKDKFSYSLTKDYFDMIVYNKDHILIDINLNENYQPKNLLMARQNHKILKLNEVFTNGELLYKFAQTLPNKLIIDTCGTSLSFDGLYYNNGIYYMSDYTNILIENREI